MAVNWKLKNYLDDRRFKPADLNRVMGNSISRTAVYGLVQDNPPKAIYLETLNVVLPALRKLTGEPVEIGDVLEFVPDPEPEALDAETNILMSTALTPPLEPYDWGPEGEPEGQLVRYVAGQGLVVDDAP